MTYRLALDVGANSIGWCALNLDGAGTPSGIRDIGVRIFPDGRHPKTLTSLAGERRLARGMRRRRDRYLMRRQTLMNALIRHGLMPADAELRRPLAGLDPYALRRDALFRKLENHELGRAIFHLNQRRGFQSNRKADRGNDQESGKIATGADRLKAELARSGHPTVGAWMAAQKEAGRSVRARLIGSGAKAEYPFYPTRDLIQAEFDAIWDAQSAWNPSLSPDAKVAIAAILFHQRPLRAPLVGRCWLDPSEYRAPKALPSTQAFRITQDLAHLTIRRPGEPDAPLTQAQRATLSARLDAGADVSFVQARKLLGLTGDATFNLESRARDKLKGAETAKRLAGKSGPLGKIWPSFDLDRRDAIVTALLDAATAADAIAMLEAFGISRDAAAAAERITLPDGHASLSTKAVRAILAVWQDGMTYDKAVQAAGYRHHSDDRDGVILPNLPYYGEVLSDRLGTGTGEPDDPDEKRLGRASNPTVHVALNQLRHVVNAVLARHGHPQEIVVEVLRELNQSAFQRRQIEKEQKANQDRREAWSKDLQHLGQRVNGRNLAFMRLWSEQAKDGDAKERVCPYTGERISLDRLFSGEVEEDHILPFALTLDDSFNNRILCMREANRRKTRRTPFDAFGASPEWPNIAQRAALLPNSKAWRFAPDALEKWKGENADFLARHMTDSAYLARLARLYLRCICDPDQVWCVPGRLTGLLRDALGLNSKTLLGKGGTRKDRHDHRHHAIDALTIGLIDRGLLQRVSTAAARASDAGRRLLDDVPAPWPGFVAEAAARVQGIVVSFKPDTAPLGKLHNETAYATLPDAGPKKPNVAHRVPIESLAGEKPGAIRSMLGSPELASQVTHILSAVAAKPAQAAALAVIPHDAAGRMVRRVRVMERLDNTAEIRERRTGRPYKRVKLDANHCVEFWKRPQRQNRPAKVEMVVVSMMQAARDAASRKSGHAALDHRPEPRDPAAKMIMRLHKDDVVAFGVGAERRLLRVVKFRTGQVTLAEVHESGNLKNRDADKGDPFKYINGSISRFVAEAARKIFVDPSGRVFDPGPLPW